MSFKTEHIKHRTRIMLYVITILLVKCIFLTSVHGAITDAELSRISQLIQEGRTDRARAEITILLDENPNDANAPRLGRILESLGASTETRRSSTTSTPTNQPVQRQETRLTPEQSLEMNTHILAIREAMASNNAGERKVTLTALLKRPQIFTHLDPIQMPYWQMRAWAALEIDDVNAGWAAGSNLKRIGALESNGTRLRKKWQWLPAADPHKKAARCRFHSSKTTLT